MAFGGVEIGIMKPMLAPRVAAKAGARGSSPAAAATAMATGTIMLADAVFEVVSDRMMATPVKRTTRLKVVGAGVHEVRPSPMARARPVVKARSPRASPP